jgi:hypothetical protein
MNFKRRLCVLERAAWDRRKREIVRARFADIARDRGWTLDRLDREVQAILDDFARIEPALEVMCRQGTAVREAMAYIADDLGVDVDELLADVERNGLDGKDRLRWR